MRNSPTYILGLAAIGASALLVSACGGDSDEAANQSDANTLDANIMMDAPANDASAMESAMNANEPAPPMENGNEGSDSPDVPSNTSGGDTADSNVSGM